MKRLSVLFLVAGILSLHQLHGMDSRVSENDRQDIESLLKNPKSYYDFYFEHQKEYAEHKPLIEKYGSSFASGTFKLVDVANDDLSRLALFVDHVDIYGYQQLLKRTNFVLGGIKIAPFIIIGFVSWWLRGKYL